MRVHADRRPHLKLTSGTIGEGTHAAVPVRVHASCRSRARVHAARRPRMSAPLMAVSPGRQKAASLPMLAAAAGLAAHLLCHLAVSACLVCASLSSRINAPVGDGHYCRSGCRCLEKEPFSCTIGPTLPTDLLFLSTCHPCPGAPILPWSWWWPLHSWSRRQLQPPHPLSLVS